MTQICVEASARVEDLQIYELLTYRGPQHMRSILICIGVDEELDVSELVIYRRELRSATHV
jgi:hypothetical protein